MVTRRGIYTYRKKTKKMDLRNTLSKIVNLIYKSRLVANLENDDLIKTILGTIKIDAPEFNFMGKNPLKNLKELCVSLLDEREPIPKENLIPQLSLILENDAKLFTNIKESIEQEMDDASVKRVITNLVKTLNNFYKETLAVDVINRISIDLKFNRNKIGNFTEYMQKAMAELEPLTSMSSTSKDPGLVNEMDFENPDSISAVFDEVKKINSTEGVYRLGWQAANRATQGGIRNEFVIIPALQHKYKTGLSLSIFMQIAQHNSPIMTPKRIGKKPLLLRISMEDNLTNNLMFMYQYLKASEGFTVSKEEFSAADAKDTTKYILDKLTATGFHIKMMRVDPSQWTYINIFNTIIGLEAQGYAVHVLMIDYLGVLPTTGCTQGPMGTDKRDLVRRVRNFTSARDIACITPWQMSSEAKQLVRNGVSEHTLVNEVAEKGYYADCKQLDQEVDLELYLHLFQHKKKKYISIRRGKHRIPTIIDDDDKYFMLQFPGLNIPIVPDLDKEDSSLTKLPRFDSGDSAVNIEGLL